MSMDKSAIEHIQKTGNPILVPETNVPALVVASGYEVKNMEKYMEAPARFRGDFSTKIINEFQSYVGQQDIPKCFIDADSMSAKAYFDLGDVDQPGHGEHSAKLLLEKLSPYTVMCAIDGCPYTQQGLAEWIEDWRDYMIGLTVDSQAIDIKKVIAAVRNITVSFKSESNTEEKNLGHRASGMEELDIRNDEGNLPAYIKYTCQPYDGLAERDFLMRLSVITNRHEKPELVLRVVQFEKHKEEMCEEFKDILLKTLNVDNTFIGSFTKK